MNLIKATYSFPEDNRILDLEVHHGVVTATVFVKDAAHHNDIIITGVQKITRHCNLPVAARNLFKKVTGYEGSNGDICPVLRALESFLS